jgi:MurNAc alpha-1-phosphate uridylyltransferase
MSAERPRAAMILAAGRGERMRPLTDTTPKPLLRVRGQPLIERHVVHLVAAGLTRIVINLAWLGTQIRDYLGDGARYGASIIYSEEAPRALEPGGGIFRALPYLSPGPYPLATLTLAAQADAHIVLVPASGGRSRDFGLAGGAALAADAGTAVALYTFGCIAVYRPAFFAGCVDGAFPLKPLLLRSIRARRCSAELYAGEWEDVGTVERFAALQWG